MNGNSDDESLRGHEQTLRSKRQQVRRLAQNGISISGFKNTSGFSYSFMKSLVDLAVKNGNQGGTSMEEGIAAFLARTMVPYSRIAAFSIQPGDPGEYRVALAEGLRRALGFAPRDIPMEDLLKLLETLVEKVDMDARILDKTLGMLHRLVMDFLRMRQDIPEHGKAAERALQLRASNLKDINYWNCFAASLFQSVTWLNEHADFIDSTTTPPLDWGNNAHIMDCELDDLDKVSDEFRNLWNWKEMYKIFLSNALDVQRPEKHPRSEIPSDDAPNTKKAKKSKLARRAAKNRTLKEEEYAKEQAGTRRNDNHSRVGSHHDPGNVNHATSDDLNAAQSTTTAAPDWPITSVEAPGCQMDRSGYEAEGRTFLNTPPRFLPQAPTHNRHHKGVALAQEGHIGSDQIVGDDDQDGAEDHQRETTSDAETLIGGSAIPQLKQAYGIVSKVLDDEYEQYQINIMAEVKVLQEERRCLKFLRRANKEITRKKLDAFWALVERFNVGEGDRRRGGKGSQS
ncbi:hypothetical protein VM1G_02438 [Cytospora mali]|uniref:Uncharacterized protein n=1 Tax=Cytospora mali TaxID=578113 RepID=A0A194VSU6_CYTMA|nr:hypothetical protein VM1G_02438 [Valsa mali]